MIRSSCYIRYWQLVAALLLVVAWTWHVEGQQLMLEEALERAPNNLTYQAQLEQIRVLEAQLQQAGKRPNPALDTESSLVSADSYELSLMVSQTWERGGKRQLRRQIAQAQLEQAILESENSLRVLVSEIRTAYLQLLWAQKQLSLVESYSKRINALLQLDLVRVEQGEIPALHTAQLQIEIIKLDAVKGQVETERWKAQSELNILIGSQAEAEYIAVEESVDALQIPDASRVLRFALSNRPDLKAIRVGVDQADLEVRMEEAVSKRDWELGTGYSYGRATLDDSAFSPLGIIESASAADHSFNLMLTIPLPFWDNNSGNVAAAKASRTLRERQLAQIESLVRSQVISAYRDYSLNQATVELYQKKLVPKLEENLKQWDMAYQLTGEGLENVLGLIESAMEAELEELEADFKTNQSLIALERAVGGRLQEVAKGPFS